MSDRRPSKSAVPGTPTPSVLDALTSHIAVLDEAGVIVEVNAAWRRFAEANHYGAAEYGVGSNYLACCESQDGPSCEGRDAAEGIRAVLGGRLADFSLEYPCHGPAEKRWYTMRVSRFDAAGRPRAVVAHENITARKLAEERTQESEARFRQLTEAVPQMVWSARPDGHVDYYNRRWYEFTGFPEGDVGEPSWVPILHPDDVERCLDAWYHAVRTGEPYEIEYRFLDRRTGDFRWHLGRALAARDASGAVARWYGTCTDIDDQKRAEEALRESDRRKDEFLATLAHELRNPLAPVRNSLEILGLRGEDPAAVATAREVIDRQVRQMVRLVDDLLDVSRITRGKVVLHTEPTDLAGVVASAVETSRPLVDARHHDLAVDLPAEPLLVEGDAARLAQVLTNLLNNAAKYTEVGGRIRLEARREGGEAVVRVRDSGVGIEPEMLPHVFDMFAQADASAERSLGGLGVGLTLVRRLVEMHGGSVEASSEGRGRGSEFVVRLPALGAGLAAPVRAEVATPTARARRRVLVVDDNTDSAESMAMLLDLWGHEVAVAHDGLTALDRARTFRPEVVLLDIELPKLDGYGVVREMRGRPELERTVLVAMTGYGQEEDVRRTREAGFHHHFVKPVDVDALKALLA